MYTWVDPKPQLLPPTGHRTNRQPGHHPGFAPRRGAVEAVQGFVNQRGQGALEAYLELKASCQRQGAEDNQGHKKPTLIIPGRSAS